MTDILSLPTEILQEIAFEAERDVMNSLRLVNKRLNPVVEPVYFSRMTIDLNKPCSQLKDLATNKTRASMYVQTFEIISLNRRVPDVKWEMELKVYLAAALCSFNKLQSLIWQLGRPNSLWRWINRHVVECLSAQASITSLELFLTGVGWGARTPLPPFRLFDHLQSFSIHTDPSPAVFAEPVTKMIVASNHTRLSRLFFDTKLILSFSWMDVGTVFSVVPTAHPLRLTHLGFGGGTMNDMDLIIPHLRSLRSLELYQSTPENIWNALQEAVIWLREIYIAVIDKNLLDYLSSYSTLKHFSATISSPDSPDENKDLAMRFYEDVLPKHRCSLLQLAISSESVNTWRFGVGLDDISTKCISRCQNLEQLTMAVDPKELRHDETNSDVITVLLKLAGHTPKSLFSYCRLVPDREGG